MNASIARNCRHLQKTPTLCLTSAFTVRLILQGNLQRDLSGTFPILLFLMCRISVRDFQIFLVKTCASCKDEMSLSFWRAICEEILTGITSCHRRLDVCSLSRHQLSLVVSKLNLPHFKALLMQRVTVLLTLDFSSILPGANPCSTPFSQP